jgi:hypothetical protein
VWSPWSAPPSGPDAGFGFATRMGTQSRLVVTADVWRWWIRLAMLDVAFVTFCAPCGMLPSEE